jgi:lauroyl/myristoyl acyltransferase
MKKLSPLKNFFSQPFIIHLGMFLGRITPRQVGWKLAAFIGGMMGKNRSNAMVRAIRANQWVIHDQNLSEDELDRYPQVIFQCAAKCQFDYFHLMFRLERLQEIVDYSPKAEAVFERIRSHKPCVLVCPHLSNFDLMGYTLALKGLEVQILSFPNPNFSYKMQNRLRKSLGSIITPMSLSAFRQARKRLRNGGSILTGLDRPLPDQQREKYRPVFFGYETNLPVTYVRMALEANAPVFIMAAASHRKGRYCLESSEPIWMEAADDLETEILTNANRVLKHGERLIKKYADQWAMFYPIWPQFLGI